MSAQWGHGHHVGKIAGRKQGGLGGLFLGAVIVFSAQKAVPIITDKVQEFKQKRAIKAAEDSESK